MPSNGCQCRHMENCTHSPERERVNESKTGDEDTSKRHISDKYILVHVIGNYFSMLLQAGTMPA